MKQRPAWLRIVAAVAAVFGTLTVVAGGRVLFGSATDQQPAGHYVAAVVWFNFLAGFLYVTAAVLLSRGHRLAPWLSGFLAVATAIAFAGFGLWVLTGGAYEARTVAAMTFRTLFWSAVAVAGFRAFGGGAARAVEAS